MCFKEAKSESKYVKYALKLLTISDFLPLRRHVNLFQFKTPTDGVQLTAFPQVAENILDCFSPLYERGERMRSPVWNPHSGDLSSTRPACLEAT